MTEAPSVDAWDPWHPDEVAERLDGTDVPWAIAAGWAVDLFLGRETRAHGDVEIAVPAGRFEQVRGRFGDCDFFAPVRGRLTPLGAGPPPPDTHQTWALERASRRWRLDIFREPGHDQTWVCRRDPAITRPYAEMRAFTPDGVPFLVPEVVLLFKAKGARPKDEADLARVLPLLEEPRRRWLASALARVHPGHPWLRRVGDPTVAD